MPLILPGNVASALGGSYEVANSCRFNQGDSPYMHITRSGADGTAGQKCTISFWFKRVNSADTQYVFHCGSPNYTHIYISSGGSLAMYDSGDNITWSTSAVLRDYSAWYHAVIKIDTTQGSNANRVKFYLNGTTEMAYASYGTVSEDAQLKFGQAVKHTVGRRDDNSSDYFDGYLAEFCFIDGLALAPTEFGEYDEDTPTIWKPKDVSGLTFGTNGFYLDFEDSANLGNDANGGTDLTETGLDATDQATDTPTNNFCTWNALDTYYSSATFAEGNTTVVTPNGSITYATGTIGLSSGRWYFEVQPYDPSDDNNIGIVDHVSTSNSSSAGELQYQPRGWCYRQAGDAYNNNSSLTGSWDSYVAGVTIGVFLDLEDNKIYWSRNGVMQNSGTGISITAVASTDTGFYFPAVGDYNGSDDTTFRTNFGGSSSFAISSAVTDDNGYGNFEYTPSVTVDSTAKKFYAICTKNLAEYG